MFSNTLSMLLLLVSIYSSGVHAVPGMGHPTLSARQASLTSSQSSSSSSSTEMFMSSWQSLSQSFTQTRTVFEQQSSVTVAYQSVQTLQQSYQAAYDQFQACSACSTGLAQSGFQTQFKQSVTEMYTSFQSIITTGQQVYGSQWNSQFAPVFKQMSSFGGFCHSIAGILKIDLGGILSGLGLNIDLFANIGINLSGILGGGSGGGLLGGILGGGSGGGLLGGILGGGQNGGGQGGGNGLLGGLLG
ncbi:uncharacterized protein VP01_1360g1 [Puccinia sorghi]|uniref:Uncharacterized protein n=1 Tax=Puccinia sorghi TaxID=27349 RepID=A0A0L6VNN4_9BASI|nr:uncharacterized protein VP01_1360g1 [Puccinia sorghi]